MGYEIIGILVEDFGTIQITETFSKREFVIEKKEVSGDRTFTELIKFELIKDKCTLLDPHAAGEELKVSFNIKGRKWEKDGKTSYFANLEAWKIEAMNNHTQI